MDNSLKIQLEKRFYVDYLNWKISNSLNLSLQENLEIFIIEKTLKNENLIIKPNDLKVNLINDNLNLNYTHTHKMPIFKISYKYFYDNFIKPKIKEE